VVVLEHLGYETFPSSQRVLQNAAQCKFQSQMLGCPMKDVNCSCQMTRLLSYPMIDLVSRSLVIERSEEHTSELQSRFDLVCRLLLEKKNLQILRFIPGAGLMRADVNNGIINSY